MSINRRMDKQILIYSYKRIVPGDLKKKKEWTHNNMDEYQKHCGEEKKSDIKANLSSWTDKTNLWW